MSAFTVLWLAWGAIFFAVEVPAMLARRRGGTLSEHVWSFMEIGVPPGRRTRWYRWKRILFLGFWAWLTLHFFAMWS